jgi:hypothetical protein
VEQASVQQGKAGKVRIVISHKESTTMKTAVKIPSINAVELVPFEAFADAVRAQFSKMQAASPYLFRVKLESAEFNLWDAYFTAFAPGTDPLFRKRTEHDCSSCRHFIRDAGALVTIVDGRVMSIWDCDAPGQYRAVAKALSALVRTAAVEDVYLHGQRDVGQAVSRSMVSGQMETWHHFHLALPNNAWCDWKDVGPKLSDLRGRFDSMARGLREISLDAVDAVLELMAQNSLYRGEESQAVVGVFRALKYRYDGVINYTQNTRATDDVEVIVANLQRPLELFCWEHLQKVHASVAKMRSTAIGTLLTDLSNGMNADSAVALYEAKVAPANYKRPVAAVTPAMLKNAKAMLESAGLLSALERRFAVIEDIKVNNVLWANRDARAAMGAFEQLERDATVDPRKFDKVEAVPVERFLVEVLPRATGLELLLDNKHAANMVTLVAPLYKEQPQLFKWANDFSWSYAGEMADSIKERVKAAGGSVTGDLRCSLSWSNYDDLDLHMREPGSGCSPGYNSIQHGYEIYYGARTSPYTGGQLDVDMNAGSGRTRSAVENITYPSRHKMREGTYLLLVHQYQKRETKDEGFTVEIEFDGVVHTFSYDKAVRQGEGIPVAKITWSKKDGFKMEPHLSSTSQSRPMWGLASQAFHRVETVMLSPNHWDGQGVGNRHWFFMLAGAKNDGRVRPFFNEFLREELSPHRKAMEVVGNKMSLESADRQLSGVGFSSTQRNTVVFRVTGTVNRVVKVEF